CTLKTINKHLFITLLQQHNNFTKTLIITFNQHQITFQQHNNINIQLQILHKQPPHHHQFKTINKQKQHQQLIQINILFHQIQTINKH
ncbi:hypothetical protein DF186_17750, partial [Enterococcus hirae]